ncbi:MAG: hypothetical protein ACAF41_04150 [Leptolyngbya sp. BL-A-14]
MSNIRFNHFFRVAITSLFISNGIPLLLAFSVANSVALQSPAHASTVQDHGSNLFHRQSIQLVQANSAPNPALINDNALLEAALKASAANLAEGYQFVKELLDMLPSADHGVTIQTPAQTIGPDNAKEARLELERRLAIYATAIRQRGYKVILGKYRTEATPSCERIQSAWADGIRKSILSDLNITQDGFTIQLIHQVKHEDKSSTIHIPGTIVESVFIFNDPMNSDFTFVGEMTPGKIIVRPDVERILAAWPTGFGFQPPSRDDLSSCTATLTPI